MRLCWSTNGVDAMNLARQRSLRQGRHQSETRCAVSRGANPHEEEQRCGHPPPGDQPKNWWATGPRNGGHQPKNWTGRCYFLTLSAPTCSSWTLAVTCPRSCVAVVQWFGAWYFAVGRNWYGFSHTYLSSAPLHRSRLLSTSSPWAPFQLQNQ